MKRNRRKNLSAAAADDDTKDTNRIRALPWTYPAAFEDFRSSLCFAHAIVSPKITTTENFQIAFKCRS